MQRGACCACSGGPAPRARAGRHRATTARARAARRHGSLVARLALLLGGAVLRSTVTVLTPTARCAGAEARAAPVQLQLDEAAADPGALQRRPRLRRQVRR